MGRSAARRSPEGSRSPRSWRRRLPATIAVLALLVAACGSRTDSGDEASDTTGATTATTSAPTETTAAVADGDPDAPCGPGDAGGATEVGVADDAIVIANIADIGGPIPEIFVDNRRAIQAFVEYCNSLGGINGRPLELLELDSALTEYRAAVERACNEAFAIVGGASVFDDTAVDVSEGCGIPDIVGFAASPKHQLAATVIMPSPNSPRTQPVGAGRYIMETYPEAAQNAAIFYAPSVAKTSALKQIEGYESIGWNFVLKQEVPINETNWGPRVEALRSSGAQYVFMQAEYGMLAGLLKEMKAQGVEVQVVEGGSAMYKQELLDAGGDAVEGLLINSSTWPLFEIDQSPELGRYAEWLETTNPGAEPAGLGIQSWSAGLLFATAAKALGSDLTRAGLLDELHSIHEWDGHGIHGTSDPGAGMPSGCFVYLRVEGGEFVRHYPDEGFSCDRERNIVTVTGTYE